MALFNKRKKKPGLFKDMGMKVDVESVPRRKKGGTHYDEALRESNLVDLYVKGFRDPSIYWDTMEECEKEQYGSYGEYKRVFRRNVVVAGLISLVFAVILFAGITFAAYRLFLMSF